LSPATAPHDLPAGITRIEESDDSRDGTPILRHPAWPARFPWLVQGITGRGEGDAFDLGVFGATPTAEVQRRWRALRRANGMQRAVHARQVHGARVVIQRGAEPGFYIGDDVDGHATDSPGALLTVSVADCVPIYVVHAEQRIAAVLHAGWRGTAAGILEAGLRLQAGEWQVQPGRLVLHLGPAICGPCYEVGPEVAEALGLADVAAGGRMHLDLRAALATRALAAGIEAKRVTVSKRCTRCDPALFSHRGGDAGRQVGFIGIRDAD
jgi:polyphenol oxidase